MKSDELYLRAVQEGDLQSAASFLAAAAASAGFTELAYHGTGGDAYTVFVPGEQGWYGSGIYFSSDKGFAEEHSWEHDNSRVMACFLKCANPYRYTECSSLNGEANFDLIREVFPKAEAKKILAYMEEEATGYIGAELTQKIQARGHDSLIAKNPFTEVREYVVYSPNQVKSADPVAYDDYGEVVALSRRFLDSPDIRGDVVGLRGRAPARAGSPMNLAPQRRSP